MAGQKMSLEEATSARLPFDVAEHIDIEEEKETKRKVEEYKQARAEYLKTLGKMAFTQQCIDDKIMPSKKQKRIIGKYTYGLKGMLFANINNTPDILYITCLLSILSLTLSPIVRRFSRNFLSFYFAYPNYLACLIFTSGIYYQKYSRAKSL